MTTCVSQCSCFDLQGIYVTTLTKTCRHNMTSNDLLLLVLLCASSMRHVYTMCSSQAQALRCGHSPQKPYLRRLTCINKCPIHIKSVLLNYVTYTHIIFLSYVMHYSLVANACSQKNLSSLCSVACYVRNQLWLLTKRYLRT